jgi:hypothetical protein
VAELGYIPVLVTKVTNACAFGDREEAERSIASREFAAGALLANVEATAAQFRRITA